MLAMRTVTVIMATVIGLTFRFDFGNVLALGLRLGVPGHVAPLVAPTVDLSVLALLLGVRYLALSGAPREQIRPARRLLILASMMTLALNVTEPVLAGEHGRAAFDAVGPLLLTGWAEVGPGLLQAISSTSRAVGSPAGTAIDSSTKASTPSAQRAQPAQNLRVVSRARDRVRSDAELLQHAPAEDTRHRKQWQRPISAETLRKRLSIGAKKSRALVAAVRAGQQSLSSRRPETTPGARTGPGPAGREPVVGPG